MPRARPVPDMNKPELRLQEAVADLTQFRKKWNQLGRPEHTIGSQMQPVPHYLIKLIREAEAAVDRMSQPAAAKRGGRPAGRGSAPDRVKRVKLKAVA